MSDVDSAILKNLFEYKDGNLYWKNKSKEILAGSKKPTGYVVVEVNGKNMMAHRIVWAIHNGNFSGQIDHIDGNRSNNKLENLRVVSNTQNQWNRKISKNNTVGIKGIRFRKDIDKYEARIFVNGKRIVLGSFKDLELAELVIQEARKKYHGDFANHG